MPDLNEIYSALQAVQSSLPRLLPPSQAELLGKQLENLLSQPENSKDLPRALNFAMQAIHDFEPAEKELESLLGGRTVVDAGKNRLYEPIPGYPIPLQPDTPVCCPVNPHHLRTRLRSTGQRCPVHNCLLVPCNLLPQLAP